MQAVSENEANIVSETYRLACSRCGIQMLDDGVRLHCAADHSPALLRTLYLEKHLVSQEGDGGMFRYRKWLPINRSHCQEIAPNFITYQSPSLSKVLNLPNLWISFNGLWPERGASSGTATFKDLEATAVLARLPPKFGGVLTLASAGNTALAFAYACSRYNQRALIVVPQQALPSMQLSNINRSNVTIVAIASPADYSDAIRFAGLMGSFSRFQKEGGVFNVARRDGMATLLYAAVETIGRLPDFYFQAVGSGAGAIAVHEASGRLIADGRWGLREPVQILSQNKPFAPMQEAWSQGRQELLAMDEGTARRAIDQMFAQVLSNRSPPYGIPGGLFETLRASGGDMMGIENVEAEYASHVFEEIEGIDIEPASAVAFASLLKVSREGRMDRDAVVLLNVTGGGRRTRQRYEDLVPINADVVISFRDADLNAAEKVAMLFRSS